MAKGDVLFKEIAGSVFDGLKSIGKGLDNYGDDILKGAKEAGKSKMRGNEAINKIGKFIVGDGSSGIGGTLNNVANKGMDWGGAIKSAHTLADGSLNMKAVAGTYIGGAAALRVAGGGGLYRDRTGRVNVPGVPFI